MKTASFSLPHASVLQSVRDQYRAEIAAEESAETVIRSTWKDTAELLFPSLSATIAFHEAPTQLRVEAA